jgi:hypothetical protein
MACKPQDLLFTAIVAPDRAVAEGCAGDRREAATVNGYELFGCDSSSLRHEVHILKAAFVLQHLLVTHFSDGLVNADTFTCRNAYSFTLSDPRSFCILRLHLCLILYHFRYLFFISLLISFTHSFSSVSRPPQPCIHGLKILNICSSHPNFFYSVTSQVPGQR